MKGIRGLLEKDFRLFFRQGGNLFCVLAFVALSLIHILMDELITPAEEHPAAKGKRLEESPRLQYLLENSAKECKRLRTTEIGTEHLLLAMIRDVDCVAAKILITLNVNLQKLFQSIMNAAGIDPKIYQEELQEDNRGSGAMMEQYCTDLTERAAEGKMDPVVGRNQEIYLSLIHI